MYNIDKMAKKPLGARIEDELMRYILQEPGTRAEDSK